MTLKVNDTTRFNLSMRLNVNYDLQYIEITVNFWNKEKHTTETKTFPTADFDAAIAHYNKMERLFF